MVGLRMLLVAGGVAAGMGCARTSSGLRCPTGQTACAGSCVDMDTDAQHCGDCLAACAASEVCTARVCRLNCGGGTVTCGGRCADIRVDPEHCGTCGRACPTGPNAAAVCVAGNCGLTCTATFFDCNGVAADGCEIDTSSSLANCGGCGAACPAVANGTAICSAGACTVGSCDADWDDCDGLAPNGCETNLNAAASDCGSCGNACPSGLCVAGSCTTRFVFQPTQTIDGATVTCSAVSTTPSYTECDDLRASGRYMPNGIECGPLWSMTNSTYSDTQGFCQSLTGPTATSAFEAYYVCDVSQPRSTWFAGVWGTFDDNGYTQHLRCYY